MNFYTFRLECSIAWGSCYDRKIDASFIVMNVNNRGGDLTCISLLEASVSESFFFRSNVFTFFLYFVQHPNISARLITLIGGVRQSSHISLRLSEKSEHLRAVHYAFRRSPNISARFVTLFGGVRTSPRGSLGFPEASGNLRAARYAFRRRPDISARLIRLSGYLRQSPRSSLRFPETVCLSRQPILLTP